MGSIIRATVILGSSSVISLIASFLSNKAYAVWIGPDGLGLLGLFQSFLGITAIGAGMGLSSGLVRLGAPHAKEEASNSQLIALQQAAWQIYRITLLLCTTIILAFSHPIAEHLLANSPVWGVGVLAFGLALSLAAGIQIGLLNAYHRVGLLAQVTALSSIFGAVWGITLVWFWRENALPWVVLGMPLGQFVLSRIFLGRLRMPLIKANSRDIRAARIELLRFGLPFVGSQIVGSAVQLGMPFLVLHQLGQIEVGYYRAAILFSTAYIGFLLNALGQDFYPRLSALQNKPQAFCAALDLQQRFVLLLGSPLVVFSLAVAPLAVSVLFSSEFRPTADILQWHLLGDLFRFVSWTLGYAVLAGLPNRAYLVTETLGGVCLLIFSLWGMDRFGTSGLGVGWLLTYFCYLIITGIVVAFGLRWRPSLTNVFLLLCAIGVAAATIALPEVGKIMLTLLWGLVCISLLLRYFGKASLSRS
ncbi:oligosaccharide flippase family protein [Meiothermus sp. CFH 77666]|uniref:oligosaccharide flippase family protein n=1 Tax=Meiothermus sp. CFH 77666 TaxID=2817942 RepID=UPI001AA0965F|nr:oligosaccharide flippase family protein [Meiothermus sp. CFH 77666]MBO1436370.1 oligosaccharide flippase family protein [Meiothermus sp. CFH 77666]